MKELGIIGAMDSEVEKIIEQMENKTACEISGSVFYEGTIYGVPVVAAKSGEGKVNSAICAEAMILKYSPKRILNTGVAGAVADNLKTLDMVVSKSVVQHDYDLTPLGREVGFVEVIEKVYIPCSEEMRETLLKICRENDINTVSGVIASGDQFINSGEKKEFLKNTFDAKCGEMESGSIGHVCLRNNVEYCALRAISDGADDDSHMDFPKFVKLAVEKSSKVTLLYIKTLKE